MCTLILANTCHAQVHEIGLSAGALNYTGDLSPIIDPLEFLPAGQAYYRYNKNSGTSFRGAILFGAVGGSDNSADPFGGQRRQAFQRTVLEVDALVEYHFLDYKSARSLVNWSPFFYTGVGGVWLFGETTTVDGTTYSPVQPIIPLGFGCKFQLAPRISINVEAGARFMFNDYLDNVSGGPTPDKNYLYGQWNVNDQYYYTGFSLCYTFYTIQCPYEYE